MYTADASRSDGGWAIIRFTNCVLKYSREGLRNFDVAFAPLCSFFFEHTLTFTRALYLTESNFKIELAEPT